MHRGFEKIKVAEIGQNSGKFHQPTFHTGEWILTIASCIMKNQTLE